jgi:hypothetical protein
LIRALTLPIAALAAFGASAQPRASSPLDDVVAYMCPIHSDYTAAAPGTCPRDGMELIRSTPFDVRDYELTFKTVPAVAQSGEPLTLELLVRHPGTREIVHDFEIVHDQPFHLFVLSRDLEHFEHIHPAIGADGVWSIGVVLPEPGHYQVIADFVPRGGAAQLLVRSLATAGYTGDLAAATPQRSAEETSSKTVGGMTATLAYDPPTFIAGLYGHLNYHLTDALTGRPVTDLQPYLGTFGHTLIVSEDLRDYVHSHPIDLTTPYAEGEGPKLLMLPTHAGHSGHAGHEEFRGGPDITFDGLMPRPGRYRAFTQFRWRDELHTFSFAFDVIDAGAAEAGR